LPGRSEIFLLLSVQRALGPTGHLLEWDPVSLVPGVKQP